MKISYNWLQSFFDRKLPDPEKLAELLSFHSFEVKSVEKFNKDWILDIDILPNRAHDCASHKGIAREISAILRYPLKFTDYSKKIKKNSNKLAKDFVEIQIEDKKLCWRYMSRVVVNVKVGLSPKWIRERLEACGLNPISNVVDITNYVMLETGQPLHAFDADKLPGGTKKKIIVRRAKKNEKIITLDNDKLELDNNVLVIADEKRPICIAGIKGGRGPEIDDQTKRVILEAANFQSLSIRKSSRRFKLRTDASWRFEHELDPNLVQEAIDMVAYLIQEVAHGQVLKGAVDVYPNKTKPCRLILKTDQVRAFLGVDISDREIIDILERLDFEVTGSKSKLQVTVPTQRLDVVIEEDLIEEIGRIYGYEKIPSQLPDVCLMPLVKNIGLTYRDKIKRFLADLGFSEVYNYAFIGKKETNLCWDDSDFVEIANPVNQEQKHLRTCLVLNLLNNIRENKKYFKDIRLFEVGKVFRKNDKDQVKETQSVAGIISLPNKTKKAEEFYQLKGAIELILNKLDVAEREYDNTTTAVPAFCHSGRQAIVKVGDVSIGWIAEISGKALNIMDIKSKAAAFEFDLDKLIKLIKLEKAYSSLSKYPAITRDIALLVDQKTKVADVLNLIQKTGGKLIRDVELFDIYEDKGIPENKKNLAFHIIYQSKDRTLIDKEINQLQQKIIQTLNKKEGWEVRK